MILGQTINYVPFTSAFIIRINSSSFLSNIVIAIRCYHDNGKISARLNVYSL